MFIRRDLVLADLDRFSTAMKEKYSLRQVVPYENGGFLGYAFEREGDRSEYVMAQSIRLDEGGNIALVDKAWALYQDGNLAASGLRSIGDVFDWFESEI